jgi:glycosyltransferase involved in cell wall biosynthesis
MHELGAGLRRAGHDVVIISSGTARGSDEVLGVPVQRIRRRGHLRRYGEAGVGVEFGVKALGRLATKRLDVWHAMSVGDATAATLLSTGRRRLRSVYTEMGFPVRASREQYADHRLYEYVARHVDDFVCLSDPAARYLDKDYGRQAAVVPGGVDLGVFRPIAPRESTPTLLFPGALSEPRKNVRLLLEAAALLADRGSPVHVWLAGPGELPADLSPLAKRGLEHASMLQPDPHGGLAELYSRAWVTVHPAEAEALGIVVIESMACGTPAVVLDDGLGPSEIVVPGTGVATQPEAAAVADACEQAIGLAAQADIVERCRARAMDYDWDTAIVPRMVDVYAGG